MQEQATAVIQERKRHEMNETLLENGINELGENEPIFQRFWNGDRDDPNGEKFRAKRGGTPRGDCEISYERFMCYYNFPRCDEEDRSLILCRSVCENYFMACNYPQDMWRCGPSKWNGATGPETPVQDEKTVFIILLAPFRGIPSEITKRMNRRIHPPR